MNVKAIIGFGALVLFILSITFIIMLSTNGTNRAANVSPSPQETETIKPEDMNKYIHVEFNKKASTSKWDITIKEVKESKKIEGCGDAKTTNNKFIAIKLDLVNNGSTPLDYGSTDFKLGHKEKKKYFDIEFDPSGLLNRQEIIYNKNNNFVGVYDKLPPSLPKTTYLVYEVPDDYSIGDTVVCFQDNDKYYYLKLK